VLVDLSQSKAGTRTTKTDNAWPNADAVLKNAGKTPNGRTSGPIAASAANAKAENSTRSCAEIGSATATALVTASTTPGFSSGPGFASGMGLAC
jgi:hypothetical protein